MQILVLYSTSEGHTAKIANRFAEVFENLGHQVFLTATSDPGYCDPGTFDAAVLCAPIHMGQYPSDFVQYISDWKSALSGVPTALVTSSLFIVCSEEDAQMKAKGYPDELSARTGWKPDCVYNVAGSLNYPQYDFFKLWMMKWAAKSEEWPTDTDSEHIFTDWNELSAYANDFLKTANADAA
ncbi:MAG: flavodoxin domain-containing protein [Pseudomonadota bacterium]